MSRPNHDQPNHDPTTGRQDLDSTCGDFPEGTTQANPKPTPASPDDQRAGSNPTAPATGGFVQPPLPTTERVPDDPNSTEAFDPLETTDFDAETTSIPQGSTAPRTPRSSSAGPAADGPLLPVAGAVLTAVSHFRVERSFERGNLGVLFRAQHLELNREVAIKEIRPENAWQPEARAEFVLEAEITGGLEHPNIVPIHELGRHDDGRPFYSMRLIRGETLRHAIQRHHHPKRQPGEPPVSPQARSLDFRHLLLRFLGVCQALAYAHSRGIIHRDLKPSNIMLGPYGETLVIDWGLAKPVAVTRAEAGEASAAPAPSSAPSPSSSHRRSPQAGLGSTQESPLRPSPEAQAALTLRSGTRKGTPAYMSPEQAEGAEVGFASDVYNLGATFYCLLTGENPVPGESPTAVLKRVKKGDFPRPREVRPEVPPALEAVCLKAMAFRPEDRYLSPLDFAHDLECWLADEPVSAWQEPWTVRLAQLGAKAPQADPRGRRCARNRRAGGHDGGPACRASASGRGQGPSAGGDPV